MSRVAYVNGRFVAHRRAHVHVEDRGYQFADGVYEVFAVEGGRLVDADAHFARLARSLAALEIAWPMSVAAMRLVLDRVIAANGCARRGVVYLQITRGVAPRNHAFPADARPSLVITARPLPPLDVAQLFRGVAVITAPDLRWRRPDIKSVSLLPNVLAKQQAVRAGCYEAWLVDGEGRVTEGTASNAWIVTGQDELVTRQADTHILAGITRQSIAALAEAHGLRIVERPFTVGEALAAREAFLSGTTSWVKPVVTIDGVPIGAGGAGPLTERLLSLYIERVAAIETPVPAGAAPGGDPAEEDAHARGFARNERGGADEAEGGAVRLGQHADRQLGGDSGRAEPHADQLRA